MLARIWVLIVAMPQEAGVAPAWFSVPGSFASSQNRADLGPRCPGSSHRRGFSSLYPGHVTRVFWHLVQAGTTPSHTRRRRRHSQQCLFFVKSELVAIPGAESSFYRAAFIKGNVYENYKYQVSHKGGQIKAEQASCHADILTPTSHSDLRLVQT